MGVDEDVVAWRRHLHRHPEVSFAEHETSAWIADRLAEFGIEVERPTETSVLGRLRGGLDRLGGLAKISALLVAADRYQEEFGVLHTSTFADDDLSSELALAALDLLDEDDGRVARLCAAAGERLLGRLRDLMARFETLTGENRTHLGYALGRWSADIGAKVIWFQPGTQSGEASRIAHDAGVTVVSRICMGATHGTLGLGPGPDEHPAD